MEHHILSGQLRRMVFLREGQVQILFLARHHAYDAILKAVDESAVSQG